MKKMLLMAAAAVFMMSCSGDDAESNNNPGETAIVPSKMIETDEDGSITSTFVYDGTKLTTINRTDGSKDVLTYTGDLLTQWISYDDANQVLYKEIFQYNAQNQLVTYYVFDYDVQWFNKYTYTHNANGTISYALYDGEDDNINQAFTEQTEEGIITANTFTTTYLTGVNRTETLTYTYDSKNNPMRNITGFDKIGFAGTEGGTKHYTENVVTQSFTPDGSTELEFESSYVYTYDANNFPLTEVQSNTGSDLTITVQYIY